MVNSVYVVKSTPLPPFAGFFQNIEDMLQTYLRSASASLMLTFFFFFFCDKMAGALCALYLMNFVVFNFE